MSSGNGVVAAKALEVLACQGYERNAVAAALGVHQRTVARWEAGVHQPSRKNRTALRALVGELILAAHCAKEKARTKARIKRLNDAALALMTDVEKAAAKAEQDEIAARLKADMQAAGQRHREEQAARFAEVRAQVAAERQAQRERIAAAVTAVEKWRPKRSAFADVDPFKIFADPQSAPLPF